MGATAARRVLMDPACHAAAALATRAAICGVLRTVSHSNAWSCITRAWPRVLLRLGHFRTSGARRQHLPRRPPCRGRSLGSSNPRGVAGSTGQQRGDCDDALPHGEVAMTPRFQQMVQPVDVMRGAVVSQVEMSKTTSSATLRGAGAQSVAVLAAQEQHGRAACCSDAFIPEMRNPPDPGASKRFSGGIAVARGGGTSQKNQPGTVGFLNSGGGVISHTKRPLKQRLISPESKRCKLR